MHALSPVYSLLLVFHFIGLALGFGGATVSDISFMKSVRKADRISVETVNWMRSFSQIVWMGIIILSLSGIGLFLLDPQKYLHSSGFVAKMILVLILVINGLFLNFYTTARLTTFNFSEKYPSRGGAWRARKLSFLFGAVSFVTWYSILFIAVFKSVVNLSVGAYIAIYTVCLIAAICGSLMLEKHLFNRFQQKKLPDNINNVPVSVLSSYPASTVTNTTQQQNPTNNTLIQPPQQ